MPIVAHRQGSGLGCPRALRLTKGNLERDGGEGENRVGADMFGNLRREFPAPSLTTFVSLQTLDILTTLIGLRVGASEGSIFISRLMRLGRIAALLISKIFAALLVCLALRWKRPRVVVFLNYWFVPVIAWNLYTIFSIAMQTR